MSNSLIARLWVGCLLLLAATGGAADSINSEDAYRPHTPTVIFYLAGLNGSKDANALRTSLQKLPSATLVTLNTNRDYARVRFDSHIVSYHQVAEVLAEAGAAMGRHYHPFTIFTVSGYAQTNQAVRVDAIFAGKRLNQRVTVKPLDKARGIFLVYFHPLAIDPKATAPQGFNGGHLHHPISDPPPRGLGLSSGYASDDDPALPVWMNAK